MTKVSRAMLSLGVTLVMLSPVLAAPGGDAAERKKSKAAPAAQTAAGKANACGCYSDGGGGCLCSKKAHCGCPGECEPRSCAEKNSKDIEREIKAATKQAEEMERKQKAARRSKDTDATSDTSASSSSGSSSDESDGDRKSSRSKKGKSEGKTEGKSESKTEGKTAGDMF